MNQVTIGWTAILWMASALCVYSSPLQKSSANPSRVSNSKTYKLNATEMAKTVEAVSELVLPSIASLERGNSRLSLGVVITSDGQVLTKLSSLKDGFQIDIGGAKFTEIEVLGIHKPSDLALLKVKAADLVAVQFSTAKPRVGSWLITPTADDSVGLLGTSCTEVERTKLTGFLGVMIEDVELEGSIEVEIMQVVPNSPAARAGLNRSDIIKSIAGRPVTDRREMLQILSDFSAMEVCSITAVRNGEEVTCHVELTERSFVSAERKLRTQFPVTLGHDTKLVRNKNCGGPIVNLSGEVVGVNILGQFRGVDLSSNTPAPASGQPRSVTLSMSNLSRAIPSEFVAEILEQLSSGVLAPAKVNRELISAKEKGISEYSTQIEELKARAEEIGDGFNDIAKRKIVKMERDLRKLENDKDRLVRGY